ncbi:alpha/beta hydrolase family esterase [Amaricoccus tamworthensis]|uniref:alpha/beta hydrolase family esterase n=1 Tax=Amaricoccus tamworthensis TaxID=57002 RepID=UPI003C7AAF8C
MDRLTALFLLAAISSGLATHASACGVETDCVVGDRTYRMALPEGHDTESPTGALIFAHGYRGTAADVMRNQNLIDLGKRLGVAVVALQSAADDWALPGSPGAENKADTDEPAYVDDVISDLSTRFQLNEDELVMAGFSAGGMLTWNLACETDSAFSGFIPLSGTFWDPIPGQCAGAPVSLVHYHGTSDTVVPIIGRKIADTYQGDVNEAVSMMADSGGYGPGLYFSDDELDCERRTSPDGHFLELCLFEGTHQFRIADIDRAWHLITGK